MRGETWVKLIFSTDEKNQVLKLVLKHDNWKLIKIKAKVRPLVNRHISHAVKAHGALLVPLRAVEREWAIRACISRASDWLNVTRLKINIFRTVGFYVFALWAGARRYRRVVTQSWTKVVVCGVIIMKLHEISVVPAPSSTRNNTRMLGHAW